MKLSIRLKLFLFTGCLILLVGGSIFLYSIFQGRRQVLATFEQEARDITVAIAGNIVNDLYSLDIRGLRRGLGSARLNPAIGAAYVTDSEGAVLADGSGKNKLRDRKLTDSFSQETLRADGWISRIEGETLAVGGPVFMADGRRLGHLQIHFSLAGAYKIVDELTRANLYITLLCLGLGGALAVIVATNFSRPISSIMRASREIGAGKLGTRLPVGRADELGSLAQSINRMAETLQVRQAEILTLNDKLERRVIERTGELSAANRELILEVAEREQAEEKNRALLDDLKTARDKMARANKVKDEFLSVISHELRTPISIITGYAGMLKDGMLGEVNAKQKQTLQKVLARSSEQLVMINDIVQVTQLEAGAVGPATQGFDLGKFLDGLKSDYEATFLNQNVELRWDYSSGAMPMATDKGKLKQALQNLINNALKFTDKGTVTVTARLQSISPNAFVEFQVADTGIGIPQDMQAAIFEKFRQADGSETRSHGGVGLGLYIAKQFTELLGGRIAVESEEGKGATFTVRIPTGRVPSLPAQADGCEEPESSRRAGEEGQDSISRAADR